jgi:hypothetical protein
MITSNTIKCNEKALQSIIKESVRTILANEDYIKYPKHRTPYDDKAERDDFHQPLKKDVDLYDIRARLNNIAQALQKNRPEDAKKQVRRLYKLIDYMIVQGFFTTK